MKKKPRNLQDLLKERKRKKRKKFRVPEQRVYKTEDLFVHPQKKYKEEKGIVDFKDVRVRLAVIQNLTNIVFDQRTVTSLYGFFMLRRRSKKGIFGEEPTEQPKRGRKRGSKTTVSKQVDEFVSSDPYLKEKDRDLIKALHPFIVNAFKNDEDNLKVVGAVIPEVHEEVINVQNVFTGKIALTVDKYTRFHQLTFIRMDYDGATGKGVVVSNYEKLFQYIEKNEDNTWFHPANLDVLKKSARFRRMYFNNFSKKGGKEKAEKWYQENIIGDASRSGPLSTGGRRQVIEQKEDDRAISEYDYRDLLTPEEHTRVTSSLVEALESESQERIPPNNSELDIRPGETEKERNTRVFRRLLEILESGEDEEEDKTIDSEIDLKPGETEKERDTRVFKALVKALESEEEEEEEEEDDESEFKKSLKILYEEE